MEIRHQRPSCDIFFVSHHAAIGCPAAGEERQSGLKEYWGQARMITRSDVNWRRFEMKAQHLRMPPGFLGVLMLKRVYAAMRETPLENECEYAAAPGSRTLARILDLMPPLYVP